MEYFDNDIYARYHDHMNSRQQFKDQGTIQISSMTVFKTGTDDQFNIQFTESIHHPGVSLRINKDDKDAFYVERFSTKVEALRYAKQQIDSEDVYSDLRVIPEYKSNN